MRIGRALYAPEGASEEMEVAPSDLLQVSNLWCIAPNFARKIQWIYATDSATYAIFADSGTDLGFEAVRFSLNNNGETELVCKIIDLDEYIATSEYEFKSEREALDHLAKNYDEDFVSCWDIKN